MNRSSSARDDGFHEVTSTDPAWIETVWFPFWIANQGLTIYVRLVVQPNAGRYVATVAAWRGSNALLFSHEAPGEFDELDALGDLRQLSLPSGWSLTCLEPLRRYAVRFAHPDCEIDIVFEGLMPPEYPRPEDSPGMFSGHLDQPGRVSGRMRLLAESFDVDCHSVRDRSWGPRTVQADLRIGNAHGTSSGEAFFAYLRPESPELEAVRGGYLWRDGRCETLVAGSRETDWDGDWPTHIRIRATDGSGRQLDAVGDCRNRRALVANPELYAVLNLVRWRLGSGEAWGENHDIWSRSAWRAAGRSSLER